MSQDGATSLEDKTAGSTAAGAEANAGAASSSDPKEVEALRAKVQELLAEKKKQQQLAQEESAKKQAAQEEALLKKGEYEQLYKSSSQERESLKAQLQKVEDEKNAAAIRNEASKIAARLAEGYNSEILTDYLIQRIKYTNEGYKVTDASGALTVSTLSDLETEFLKSDKYKSLRKGSKASGGGATGSSGGASSNAKEIIDRTTFNGMKSYEQSDFNKRGGVIKD